ncbi:MAG TPA: glycoside hydrolase family 130 protein, partial [Ignavibacteriales bacterium]|nr:glycoside hydrolase family 130 protein [Ignavibacteriales bacterium]
MRYEKNPVLTKENVAFNINSIFNPGAVKFQNKYLLMCRIEMPNGRSSFVRAWSENGFDFTVEPKPCLTPEDHKEYYKYVEWGIEDTRITQIGDTYYLTYTGYSKYMPLVILTETKDFENFEIHGPITEPSNKDCCLFPEKIDGYYWKVDRPSAETKRDIWISRSKDLLHWGGYEILTEPVPGTWENDKIGASTPPVRTKEGWLMLYHGVRGFGISTLYKLGVLLLDLEKPWIIKGRSKEPILVPDLPYERIGDV